MTGKEALDELMETFYELCEECNCNEDMYQKHNLTSPHHIIRKELELLTKYKRAFEILKDKGIVEIGKHTNLGSFIYQAYGYDRYLEKEEYELLEELMKDAKD